MPESNYQILGEEYIESWSADVNKAYDVIAGIRELERFERQGQMAHDVAAPGMTGQWLSGEQHVGRWSL
jgi:hypothetical protein